MRKFRVNESALCTLRTAVQESGRESDQEFRPENRSEPLLKAFPPVTRTKQRRVYCRKTPFIYAIRSVSPDHSPIRMEACI